MRLSSERGHAGCGPPSAFLKSQSSAATPGSQGILRKVAGSKTVHSCLAPDVRPPSVDASTRDTASSDEPPPDVAPDAGLIDVARPDAAPPVPPDAGSGSTPGGGGSEGEGCGCRSAGAPVGSGAAWPYATASLLFAFTGIFAPRPAPFLEWARNAGLLRVTGIAYQFRHDSYQQWLAAGDVDRGVKTTLDAQAD